MGLEVVAYIAAAAAVTGTVVSIDARNDQRRAQEKAASEQKASNAAEAAKERRQQVREERVRRARIMQSSENTGVAGGSGEAGALGSLSTNLSSNIGFNLGALQRAGNISDFNQQAADAGNRAQTAGELGQLGMSVFSAAGGFNTIFPKTK